MFNAVPLLLVLFGKHTICQLSFHPMLLFFKQFHPTHHLSMGATSPIFCFSGSFSEMNVRAVRVQFSKIFFFGSTSLPALVPNSKFVKFRLVGSMCLVGARRSSETPSFPSKFFFSHTKSWRVVIFTHKFWRGLVTPVTTAGFGAPMPFWRKNSNFAGTLLLVDLSLPTLNVKLTSAVAFTLAPKSAQLPQRFHSSKSQDL